MARPFSRRATKCSEEARLVAFSPWPLASYGFCSCFMCFFVLLFACVRDAPTDNKRMHLSTTKQMPACLSLLLQFVGNALSTNASSYLCYCESVKCSQHVRNQRVSMGSTALSILPRLDVCSGEKHSVSRTKQEVTLMHIVFLHLRQPWAMLETACDSNAEQRAAATCNREILFGPLLATCAMIAQAAAGVVRKQSTAASCMTFVPSPSHLVHLNAFIPSTTSLPCSKASISS